MRKNSFAFCGGVFGDEGKGRVVDELVDHFSQTHKVVVYRDNGGANAGHTVELDNGQRIAFHQLPSGVFHKRTTIVLGKGMVIHPGDLIEEIAEVKEVIGKGMASIVVDKMAVLSLDTHRAFEAVLKEWESGGKGATGRGISPAYADILLRHPLRVRDLMPFNEEKIIKHYHLYKALVFGLGKKIQEVEVPQLGTTGKILVGIETHFLTRLRSQAQQLKSYVGDGYSYVQKTWKDKKYAFVFEKAQAIGLDTRWGVYPDVTASDTTFDGIFSATEAVIDPEEITIKAAVIKATYMSSVGTRKLPSVMDENLAHQIREDGHEYGATTKRPRGIFYLDMPALTFFLRVGHVNRIAVTHMDMVYPDVLIKVCVAYTQKGRTVPYRPDQEYLNTVKPKYQEFAPWDKDKLRKSKTFSELPKEVKVFLRFLEKTTGTKVYMITTGPKRHQSLYLEKL